MKTVEVVESKPVVSRGSVGLRSQVHGTCVTVSAMSSASGIIREDIG